MHRRLAGAMLWMAVVAVAALGAAVVQAGQEGGTPQAEQSPQPQPEPQPQPAYTCERLDRVPHEQRCAFVREECESDSRLPYTEWYYCSVAPHGAVAGFLFTLFLASLLPLYFTLLGDTAEIYFSPIMTHVSQSIPKMRPRFAGVTFVAIGNGAPDLSSNISAIRNGDVLLSAGALTGAAMFVQCVVASEVMRASRGPVNCRGATLRDVAIYSASVLMVLAAFAQGTITHWFIAGAVLLYLTYAVWVFVGDEWHERGRPQPNTLWRGLRSAVEGRFRPRQELEGLPWAQVDVGPTAGAASSGGSELMAPLVGRSSSGQQDSAGAGVGIGGRVPSRPTSPGGVPAQRPGGQPHHHLMSAKAYQSMVWADLSPEEPQGLPQREREGTRSGDGGSGVRHRRQAPGRRHDHHHHPRTRGAGGGAAGSSLELGASFATGGYAPPSLPPLAPDGGGSGSSQLLTLSSLDGSALAAPAPVAAAPWGSVTSATAAAALAAGSGAGGVAADGSAGATVVRTGSLGGGVGLGSLGGAGVGGSRLGLAPSPSLDPWGGVTQGSEDDGSYDSSDEEEAGLLEAHRRGGRGGGGGSRAGGDGDGGSVASSRQEPPPRGLWETVQYELTVGASAEWEELPPDSLRRRWRRLTFPLLLPVYAALRLTIPFVDPATYSRRWLLATCACAPLLAAVYLAPSAAALLPMALTALALGAMLAFAVGYFTAGEEDALPDWDLGTGFAFGPAGFAIFGFFMGVVWIDTLASEVVGVIGLLAGLLRVPSSVMGLTLLAWGNSLGDFFGNPAMARRGQPTMALTACFAGPLFNMLASLALGFGSYFARRGVTHADVVLRPEVALGCVFLVVYNGAVAAAGLLNGGKLPERFYVFARAWYATYFAAACALGLWAGQGAT